MIVTCENATVTINGKPLEFSSLEWSSKEPEPKPLVRASYSATWTTTVTGKVARAWFGLLESLERRHQLAVRLRRRLRYGGRKGRSAARRLRAMGMLNEGSKT